MNLKKCCGLVLLLIGCGSGADPYVGTWQLTLTPTGGTCGNATQWTDTVVVTGPPYYVTVTGDTASTAAGDQASASADSSGLTWIIEDDSDSYSFTMPASGPGMMSEYRTGPGYGCTETWALSGTKD